MIQRWFFKRKVRKTLIARLLQENANLRAMLKAEQDVSAEMEALHEAAFTWLRTRIAARAAQTQTHHYSIMERAREFVATSELERHARRCFLAPGMQGSWGRGVTRTWNCEFDPKGGGCECAGGGMTDEECKACFYRPPIGEKGKH